MNTNTKKAAPPEPNHTAQPSCSFPGESHWHDPFAKDKTPEKHIEYIMKRLYGPGINSANRLPEMLSYLGDFSFTPKVAWPVIHSAWGDCDNTWEHREDLIEFLDMLNSMGDSEGMQPTDYLRPEDKAAFESQPNYIRIYRGCSISRVYGFSWTADRKIAESFAQGHRGIIVPDPVIASFRIPKTRALGYYTDRMESEVLVDPSDVKRYAVTVTKFWDW